MAFGDNYNDTDLLEFAGTGVAMGNAPDVVLIDTAGRLHNKVNLMNELKKIKEVMKCFLRVGILWTSP